jgi:hypothetical protein
MVIGIIGIIGTTVVVAVTVAGIAEAAAVEIVEAVVAVRTAGRVAEIGDREGQVETVGPGEQAEAGDRKYRKNKRFEITRK